MREISNPMPSDMLQDTVEYINRQYPWATEDTVSRLAELSRSSNIKSVALAAGIQKALGAADAARLENYINLSVKEINKSSKTSADIAKKIKSKSNELSKAMTGQDQQGLENISNLAHATAQAVDKLGDAAGDLFSYFGKMGDFADTAIGAVTGTTVAFTGVAAVFSSLITEQEKQLRGMIEQGIVLGDLVNYTDIRGQLANLGMTMNDYNGLLQLTSGLMTNDAATGRLSEGSSRFLNFLSKSSTVEQTRHFGYTPREVAKQLAGELEMLYNVNEVNKLDSISEQRAVDSFRTVNKMAIFMAESFGIQRSALLEQRRAARENQDFVRGMNKNSAYMNERYGAGASEVINTSFDTMTMLSGVMGEEFQTMVTNASSGFIADINQTDSMAINIANSETFRALQRLSPEAAASLINVSERALTGQIPDQTQLIAEFSRIFSSIKDANPLMGNDSISQLANKLIAQSQLMTTDLSDLSIVEIQELLDTMETKVDNADNVIEGIGELSRTFLQAQHQITPGYNSMGNVLNLLTNSTLGLANMWRDVFGNGEEYDLTADQIRVSRAQEDLHRRLVGTQVAGLDSYGGSGSGSQATMSGSQGSNNETVSAESLQLALEKERTALAEAKEQEQVLKERLENGYTDKENDEFIAALETKLISLQESSDVLGDKFRKAQQQYNDANNDVTAATEKFNNFIYDAKTSYDDATAELENAISKGESRNTIAALLNEQKLRAQALEEREAQASDLKAELDRLTKERNEFSETAAGFRSEETDAIAQLEAVESELVLAVEDVDAYRASIAKDSLELQREIITKLEASVSDISEKLSAEQQRIEQSAELGSLSAKYESAKAGAIAIGNDSGGGFSYGTYQIATKPGTFGEYMNFLKTKNPDLHQQLQQAGGTRAATAGTQEFKNTWRSLMRDNEDFIKTQHDFIQASHYDPQAAKIKNSTGVDINQRSKALRDVLWSSSVQHRNRASTLFKNAIADLGASASDEDIIRHVYRGRAGYLSKLTPREQASVMSRYRNEQKDALSMLQSERTQANIPANDVRISELQSQQQSRINEINSITEDPSRLNSGTGDVSMQGLDESQIKKLTILEQQLQRTIKEIAKLQSSSGGPL